MSARLFVHYTPFDETFDPRELAAAYGTGLLGRGWQGELRAKWAEANAELLGEIGPMLTPDSQAHR